MENILAPQIDGTRDDYIYPEWFWFQGPDGVNFKSIWEPHMTFNFNARYALLTYSQCGDLDGWEVSNHFTKLRAECIVAKKPMLMVEFIYTFVDFGPGRKFRSRRSDVFDVGGFHPNISPTHSTPQSGFDYACKDGDIVAGGLERPTGSVESRTNADWSAIVAAPTREEFFAAIMEQSPRTMHLIPCSGEVRRLEISD